jgi:hypothetical protein
VEEKLGRDYSIDRIDNCKGYEPDNIRFVDRHTQMVNRRIFSNSSTGYNGVGFHKASGKYRARIRLHGKRINIGLYETAKRAHAARQAYIVKNNLEGY